MFKEWLDVLVLIAQSEYHSILQVSKSKDSVLALDGQHSEQNTMRPIAAKLCTMCDH